ncbi:MAG TPA: serine/threonine-protein kinase [Gemmatimonadales bacterium]|nr:serine/threonine-protein kinase [Gemmatimonadales bacterium]
MRAAFTRIEMDHAENSLTARLIKALGTSYTVEGEIGRGGMGVVFNARDERLKRHVAIKVLPPELAFREEIRLRFLREAETAARLSHPHIVPIHSVGEGPDGLVYFVMAFVDGESLAAKLKRRGRLPPDESRRIIQETADALGAAHALGIIHRDVKPDNILLEGSRGRVVVTDFGIAKALSSSSGAATLTATGVAIGTPHYMSPEQAAGDREIDGRSDIYSLGVVSYQMLTGELPFHAPTVPGILMKHITERAPLVTDKRPDTPDDLAACVMRCLEKDPDDRWPTADALRRALESRSATLHPPRRSGGAAAPSWAPRQPPAPPALPVPRPPPAGRDVLRRGRPPRRRELAPALPGGEAAIVRDLRRVFVTWASVCGSLVVIDIAMAGHHLPGWSIIVTGVWAGVKLVPRYVRLWNAGYSWRDVLARPPASDAVEVRFPSRGGRPTDLPTATTGEFGSQADAIQQARSDRKAILRIMERVPKSEKKLLPDVVVTVDGLLHRGEELARAIQTLSADVDPRALARLQEKIEATKRQPDSPERERQVDLLERQRRTLTDLLTRRQLIEDQIESCVLAMQNVRFDLLRLRSAGVAAVLDDLTHATQHARALSADVDHAIAAAGEIREALGQQPGA